MARKKTLKVTCGFCQKDFYTYSKGKASAKYCSKECSSLAKKRQRECVCAICKKIVYRAPSSIPPNGVVYCSRTCTNEGKKGVSVNTKEKISKKCEYCGEEFWVLPCHSSKKMCSRECADRAKEKKVPISCSYCGEEFLRRPSRIRFENNFCSDKCMGSFYAENYTGEKANNYQGGAAKYYGPTWRQQRRLCRERDSFTCQDCGLTEEEHLEKYGAELDTHHITPFVFWKSPEEANSLDNLILLCKVCHQKRHCGDLKHSNYDKDKFHTL